VMARQNTSCLEWDEAVDLILACCRQMVTGHEPFQLPASEVPLGALYVLAARTRTLGLLATCKREGGSPDWFRRELRLKARALRERSLGRLKAADEISTALRDADVLHAFRKGVHMDLLYPHIGIRQYSDLDLWVHPRSEKTADAVLTTLGYSQTALNREQFLYLALATNCRAPFERRYEEHSLVVDVSRSLLIPALARRFGEEDPAPLAGDMVRRVDHSNYSFFVLEPRWNLIDLALNGFINTTAMRYVNRLRFQRVDPWLDLVIAATKVGADDMGGLFGRMSRINDCVAFSLSQADRILSTNLMSRFGHLLGPVEIPSLDSFGSLDFEAPVLWNTHWKKRYLLDDLPPEVPIWRGPM